MRRREVHTVVFRFLLSIERLTWMLMLGSLLSFTLGANASGAEQPTPTAPAPAAAQPAPIPIVAIPLPEISERAEAILRVLAEMETQAQLNNQISLIEKDFSSKKSGFEAKAKETQAGIEAELPIERLGEFKREWLADSSMLGGWLDTVTDRANWFEQKLGNLDVMRKTWEATREQARQSEAPTIVFQRIDKTLSAIQSTRAKLEKQWTPVLILQNHLSIEKLRAEDKLDALDQAREARRQRLFQLDAPPAWTEQDRIASTGESFRAAVLRDWGRIKTFWEDQHGRIEIHALILILFFSLALSLRLRFGEEAQATPGTEELLHVVRRPASTALLAVLLLNPWLYPYAPRVVLNLLYLILLIPVIRLLVGLLHPSFRPFLIVFGVFFVLDSIRTSIEVLPLLSRMLLLIETLSAVGILIWLMRPVRLTKMAEGPRIPRFVGHGMRVALVLFAVSSFANVLGALSLSKSLGNGVFVSIYAAVGIYAAMRAAQLLMITAVLRFRVVNKLYMVRNHRSKLIRRGMRLIRWVAVIVWFLAALRSFSIEGEILTGLRDFAVASVHVGTIQISLGNILGFIAALYGANLLWRGLRFVLEEEIFKRVELGRGVANAITATLHYVVWFLGGILALGAAGIDMSKFSLLAGALGVGIGFGLQNVVNNFVSGLILLYERPIQVGDTIEATDGIIGNVRRIGIRSSTVRTWEGAELIVPNANLISEKVTNWTLSDRLRRIDLPVGVAYGTNPKRVIDVLAEAVRAHVDVLADPAPEIFFTGFGDSSLNFVMRFWTGEFSRYLAVRSEVAVSVYDALEVAKIQVPFPQRDLHLRSVDPSISFKPEEKG